MPIWDIFKKTQEEPVQKKVDPIVEQRRKEKFSTPLIYNEEKQVTEEKVVTQTKTTTQSQTPNKIVKPKTESVVNSGYRMSEIISPFYGRKEEPVASKTKQSTPKKTPKRKPI